MFKSSRKMRTFSALFSLNWSRQRLENEFQHFPRIRLSLLSFGRGKMASMHERAALSKFLRIRLRAGGDFDILSPTVELLLGEGVVTGDLVAQLGAVLADGHHDR